MSRTIYKQHTKFPLSHRNWPENQIQQTPRWGSLDLYLGEQSILHPMSVNDKIKLFKSLTEIGFKEISISNPFDSEQNKVFLERIINEALLPEDVWLQITLPLDEALISNSIPLLSNIPKLTLQLEIPCSLNFSTLIFSEDKIALKERTIRCTQLLQSMAKEMLSHNQVQYSVSLEDFMATDTDFLLELSTVIVKPFLPSDYPFIFHLPNTVDYLSPSHYADGIEWFSKNFPYMQECIISAFSKNNRGNAVACCELALQAGAAKIEGSLLGIGERAGNNDLITMILNLQSLNIDPNIHISDINGLAKILKTTTHTDAPIRHPYVGDLSFTALSNYQQNIIFKGLKTYESLEEKIWNVPYFTLNPADVGRVFEVLSHQADDEDNEQVLQLLKNHYDFQLPELLAFEFSNLVKAKHTNETAAFIPEKIKNIFMEEYIFITQPIILKSVNFEKATLMSEEDLLYCKAKVEYQNEQHELSGSGFGALDTLVDAIRNGLQINFDVATFNQHSLHEGSKAKAATYLKVVTHDNAKGYWGVGVDSDSTLSAIKAFFNALNRSQQAL